MRTHVKFTCANEIEAMYEKPQVNATYTFTRDLPYTLPVIYLRAYARKNYATMKIHLYRNRTEINVFFLPTEALSSMVFVPA